MLKIDLHIHSVHSGHAYGTFYDIVNEAIRKEMKVIAITDHGPTMKGTSSDVHFRLGHRKPKFDDLRVLWGCEANIIDGDGNLDILPKTQKMLDLIVAGLHKDSSYNDLGFEGNTMAIKRAIENPYVKIISHPLNYPFDYDFEAIIKHALDNGVLPELNLHYLEKYGEEDLEKLKRFVVIVKESKKKLIVNSDAHFVHEIGDDSILKKYWDELGLCDEIIINNYPDELMKFLEKK